MGSASRRTEKIKELEKKLHKSNSKTLTEAADEEEIGV